MAASKDKQADIRKRNIRTTGVNPGVVCLLAIVMMLFSGAFSSIYAAKNDGGKNHRVLLLNSYHSGFKWTDDITSGIREALTSEIPGDYLFVEYMDTKNHPPEKVFPVLTGLYARKYADFQPAVIICSDNNALEFLLRYRNFLFPGVPIVFCGINNFSDPMLLGHKDITGVVEAVSFRETIELALCLHPQTKSVFSVAGSALTSQIHTDNLAEVAREFDERVDFIGLHGLSVNQLAASLQKIPPNSIVLYLGFHRDKKGRSISVPDSFSIIRENTANPVYTFWTTYLPYTVGGVVINGEEQGRRAAAMALKIIRGQSAQTIPVIRESPNVVMINYDEFLRVRADPESIPDGALIVNPPSLSIYAQYRYHVWTAAMLILILMGFVVLLISMNIHRRNAISALKKAQNYISDIINSMPSILIGIDTKGTVSQWNSAAQRQTGVPAEDAVGMPIVQAFPRLADKINQVREAIQTRKVRSDSLQTRSEDGETLFEDLTIYPLIIEDVEGAVIRIDDVTERKRAEEALRESEEKYRLLFELESDVILLMRKSDGQILEVNKAGPRIYGYSYNEFLKMKNIDLSNEPEKTRQAVQINQTKVPLRYHRKKNGTVFPVEINGSLLKWKGEEARIATIRDITERVEAEKEKDRLEIKLLQAQKMEAIGTLAGGIAHDFNNILAPILGHTEMVMMDLSADSQLQFHLNEIHKATERARNLVKQILTFSRQKEQERIPLRVNLVLKEALELLRSSIPTTIEIKQNIKTESDTVFADPTQVHQIVVNLCTNAAHAMREKGGVLEVNLTSEILDSEAVATFQNLVPGAYVKLEVRDTGHGIKPENIERIFEPYFTTKGLEQGTGLGLAVIHGIIKSYDGEIMVESELEKGTTFKVWLPAVEVGVAPVAERQDAIPGGTETILFVDDEEIMIGVIPLMLEKLGYKVIALADSIEALEFFRNKPDACDLVITDMTMPNMTGEELAREIMKIEPFVPIMLCTGFSDQIDERKAKEMGIRAFVMKPVDMTVMANVIRSVLDEQA